MTVNKNTNLSLGRVKDFISNYGSLVGIVVLFIVFQFFNPNFLKLKNVLGVINSSTILVIMSLAMMTVMAVRGIDLSIAQVADMTGVVAAMLIIDKQPIWLVITAALVLSLIVGLINCLVISYLGVPAIIGTLGMMFIVRSVELTVTNGAQPQILFTLPPKLVKKFFYLGQGAIGKVTILMIICAIIILIMYLFRERSIIGRQMDAIQGNVKAAYLSSIDVRKVFGSTFIISSFLAGIAGVLLVSRSGNAMPRGVEPYLTDCFVAVYVGTLFSRQRKFNVIGTVIGALFVGFLNNFLNLMGMSSALKNLFYGIFILLAVALSVLRNQKQKS